MTDSNDAVDARIVGNRYRLEREVGRGGMGAVWLGMDTLLRRPVALKQIGKLPGEDEPDAARVRREARVSAMLNHEHVVAVFDLVESDDQPWLVMEYLESENLAQRIRREGPADAGRGRPRSSPRPPTRSPPPTGPASSTAT